MCKTIWCFVTRESNTFLEEVKIEMLQKWHDVITHYVNINIAIQIYCILKIIPEYQKKNYRHNLHRHCTVDVKGLGLVIQCIPVVFPPWGTALPCSGTPITTNDMKRGGYTHPRYQRLIKATSCQSVQSSFVFE